MHEHYERRAVNDRSWFDPAIQRALIERAQEACAHLRCQLHGAASEVGHLHFALSWRTARTWESVRASFKSSLTRFLRDHFPGTEFSRGASRKRVKDNDHLSYLLSRYLPNHPGWGWYEDRGWVPPKR
jgi:REP element-mobilizing transposase RayT